MHRQWKLCATIKNTSILLIFECMAAFYTFTSVHVCVCVWTTSYTQVKSLNNPPKSIDSFKRQRKLLLCVLIGTLQTMCVWVAWQRQKKEIANDEYHSKRRCIRARIHDYDALIAPQEAHNVILSSMLIKILKTCMFRLSTRARKGWHLRKKENFPSQKGSMLNKNMRFLIFATLTGWFNLMHNLILSLRKDWTSDLFAMATIIF